MFPGKLEPRGMDNWSDRFSQSWVLVGTDWTWTIQAPVFDLRPGLSYATGMPQAAVPVNHEAALGLSVYFNIAIASLSGLRPPAIEPGIRCFYWEDGNPVAATPMQRYTKVIEITTVLLSGGDTVGTNAASLISLSPVQSSLRFWQPSVQITIPDGGGLTPPTTNFFAIAAVH